MALIGVFPPPSGGQGYYNLYLAEELRRRGWSIAAIDVSSRPSDASSQAFSYVHAPTRKVLTRTLLSGHFDLLHLTASDTRIMGFETIVGAVSRIRRIPFIYNLLAGGFGQRLSHYGSLKRRVLAGSLRGARCFLVSNEGQVDDLRSLSVLADTPALIAGCLVPLTHEVEEDPEISSFLAGGRPSIISIGALRPVYAFPFLVDACRTLAKTGLQPRLLLIAAGDEDPSTIVALEAARQDAQPLVPIRLVREIPRGLVLGAVRAADILARPTLADGDSLSVHEALQLGTTVVASDAAPRPDGVILFRVGDKKSLSENLRKAYLEPVPASDVAPSEQESLVDRVIGCYETVLARTSHRLSSRSGEVGCGCETCDRGQRSRILCDTSRSPRERNEAGTAKCDAGADSR